MIIFFITSSILRISSVFNSKDKDKDKDTILPILAILNT